VTASSGPSIRSTRTSRISPTRRHPGNSFDVEPNVALTPLSGVTLQAGVDFLWRVSKHDAVYIPRGIPLLPGSGQGPNREVSLPFARLAWTPSEHWELDLSYVAIMPGPLLGDAGAHTTHFIRTSVVPKF
jgi:hypothetical protein